MNLAEMNLKLPTKINPYRFCEKTHMTPFKFYVF